MMSWELPCVAVEIIHSWTSGLETLNMQTSRQCLCPVRWVGPFSISGNMYSTFSSRSSDQMNVEQWLDMASGWMRGHNNSWRTVKKTNQFFWVCACFKWSSPFFCKLCTQALVCYKYRYCLPSEDEHHYRCNRERVTFTYMKSCGILSWCWFMKNLFDRGFVTHVGYLCCLHALCHCLLVSTAQNSEYNLC